MMSVSFGDEAKASPAPLSSGQATGGREAVFALIRLSGMDEVNTPSPPSGQGKGHRGPGSPRTASMDLNHGPSPGV